MAAAPAEASVWLALILMSNVAVIIAADNLMLTLNSVMNGPSPAGEVARGARRGRGGRGKRTAESFEILISFQIRRPGGGIKEFRNGRTVPSRIGRSGGGGVGWGRSVFCFLSGV